MEDWGALTLAGAFVVGIVFGVLVALRVLKMLWGNMRVERRRDRDEES